jgi:TolA-binding protein
MMKRFLQLLALVLPLGGCASLGLAGGESADRTELWNRAQNALAVEEFSLAEGIFEELVGNYPETLEGRESLFYLGSLRLDPRNPDWDPRPAETRLAEYLAIMEGDEARIYRYPEARTLHELARQLNLPPESRVAGLQPEERVVTVEERVVVPGRQSRELTAQVAELRRQLAERDARIQQQQEELERIRRTLTGPGPGAAQR